MNSFTSPIRTRVRSGFTLLETLIYIALFGLIVLGAFSSIAALQASSEQTRSEVVLIEESSFLADLLQSVIEETRTVPTAADVVTSDALHVSAISFIHSAAKQDDPEHISFSFTLTGIGTQVAHSITVNRTVYLTP